MQPAYPLNLLFIDDDPDDGEALQKQINIYNPSIHFLQVYDGWQAMMYLQKLSAEDMPSLIILDINMRIINGFEFLKVVKGEAQYKDIPVIVYSTSERIEDRRLSLELGAIDFYTKPNTLAGLQAIAKIVTSICAIESLN